MTPEQISQLNLQQREEFAKKIRQERITAKIGRFKLSQQLKL